MRNVKVFLNANKKRLVGIGKFHAWGIKAVEYSGDIVTQTVAIVEFEDGRVEEVYPKCMDFIVDNEESLKTIKTVRCHYDSLSDYCNQIGREHIISITSCYGENYGEHFFTLVYDTPVLVLKDA